MASPGGSGYGIVSSFDGYQSGDPAVVADQVFAIWHVLQERGFRYSDITTTATDSDDVARQHVRLFDDASRPVRPIASMAVCSWRRSSERSASTPISSAFPATCSSRCDLDEEGEKTIAIETTMMGDKADEASDDVDWLPKKELKVRRKAPGWFAFEAAVQTATKSSTTPGRSLRTRRR